MHYEAVPARFFSRALGSDLHVAVARTGDYAVVSSAELMALQEFPNQLPLDRLAYLRARFLVDSADQQPGLRRLAMSRIAAKRETVTKGPSLHLIVPTLTCAHSCRYCQVSRALDSDGYGMSVSDLDLACETILQSEARNLTVEFQGGDPLLRFDLIQRAVTRIGIAAAGYERDVRFVVASTLHQLTEQHCEFFREHGVFVSTSIDGPPDLHNKNRPVPTRDAHQRTLAGVALARRFIGAESVSALMTTTRESLLRPEDIVDEYVELGFRDIFLRPLSLYGFAKRNETQLRYSLEEFEQFYDRAFERVLYWNRKGFAIREVYAGIILNKLLSSFDSGYVDLQSPTGAGASVLVYNYDGFVYPSDEARMLLETGDSSMRLGRIGTPLSELLQSPVRLALEQSSRVDQVPGCSHCAYQLFCAPQPIDAYAQQGSMHAPVHETDHCRRHLWMFDSMLRRLHKADEWSLDLFHRWADL